MRKIEQIYIASGRRTEAPLTKEELKEFYITRLAGASSGEEARTKDLLLNIRDFVSADEEEQYGPKISHTRHFLVEPPQAAITTGLRTPVAVEPPMKRLVDDLEAEVTGWLRNSFLRTNVHGKVYQLLGKIRAIQRAFLRGEPAEGERLTAALSQEMTGVRTMVRDEEERFERVLQKDLARRKEVEETKQRENAWADYQKRAAKLRASYGSWPGFGIYRFPMDERGEPQDYQESGKAFRFDWANTTDVLPERGKSYWGFVTQWGNPSMVALLVEAIPEPTNPK